MKTCRSTKGLMTLDALLNNRNKVELATGLMKMRKLWMENELLLRNVEHNLRKTAGKIGKRYTNLEVNRIMVHSGLRGKVSRKPAVKKEKK